MSPVNLKKKFENFLRLHYWVNKTIHIHIVTQTLEVIWFIIYVISCIWPVYSCDDLCRRWSNLLSNLKKIIPNTLGIIWSILRSSIGLCPILRMLIQHVRVFWGSWGGGGGEGIPSPHPHPRRWTHEDGNVAWTPKYRPHIKKALIKMWMVKEIGIQKLREFSQKMM